jgi:hypothetical protein
LKIHAALYAAIRAIVRVTRAGGIQRAAHRIDRPI